jgi:outer membrane protein OmpA-like peptidoglycan-associated protein
VHFASIHINEKLVRHALLAGTMLTAAAVPHASAAGSLVSEITADAAIVLAQAAPIDAQTGRPVQPKGAQPKAKPQTGAPKGPQPQVTQPAAPVPPAQPRHLGQQPPAPGGAPAHVAPPRLGQPTPAPAPGTPSAAQPRQPGQASPAAGAAPHAPPSHLGTAAPAAPVPATAPAGTQTHQLGQPLPMPGAAAPQPQQQQQRLGRPGPAPAGVPAAQPPAASAPVVGAPAVTPQPQLGRAPAPPGAAAPVANVEQLRTQRHERTEGGRVVIEEPGQRVIVREGSTTIIRHDETERFRRWGAPRIEQRGSERLTYIERPGGYQIVNVTDPQGRLLRRLRRGPDGREVVIIDNRGAGFGAGVAVGVGLGLTAGLVLGLAPPVITIPREHYIVTASAAPAPLLYEALEAPPVVPIERAYSLDEIRYNVALRDRMRRIDIDSITFDSGAWEVTPDQQPRLEVVAEALRRILARHPDEIFLIEGHTDAVGSDVDNLSLSDRRAESVAVLFTDAYQIPPENLVTQGYGEQNLKIPTDGPNRDNRRVTVRRITPLLHGTVASR